MQQFPLVLHFKSTIHFQYFIIIFIMNFGHVVLWAKAKNFDLPILGVLCSMMVSPFYVDLQEL